MAKKEYDLMHPPMVCGVVILVIGFLYLLKDLGFASYWNFQWYTFAFLLLGIKIIMLNYEK